MAVDSVERIAGAAAIDNQEGRIVRDGSRMMKATESLGTAPRWARRRVRWTSPRPTGERKRLPAWRRVLRGLCITSAIVGLSLAGHYWMTVPPTIEPPFERIVAHMPGPVKDFALKDPQGAVHTRAEWTGRPGVVLFLIAIDCPISKAYAGEMARLAKDYSPRGVAFYGVHADPGVTTAAAADHAARHGLPFPVVLDPAQIVARQLGARVTPEAVVLADDGQVLYHGRIDDRFSGDGSRRPRVSVRELENAIRATLADELPPLTYAEPFGSPLPSQGGDGSGDETITFTQHVAPILWNNCARCHRPGAVAPFSLISYKDAAKRADFICEVVSSGRMPPWKPQAGAGVFRDASQLSAVEKELLERWAQTGRQEGNPALLPPMPRFNDGWQIGEPDVVLTMTEPFRVPASGGDPYWAFALPANLGRDLTINAIEFRPGNRRVVHHSRVYLDTTGDAQRRDLAEPGAGFPGWGVAPGTMELPYPGLGGWTPGMTPRAAPDGVGRLVPNGSDIVFRIHYHPSGKPEEDRSSIGLYATKKPVTRHMAGLVFCTNKIDIPPGDTPSLDRDQLAGSRLTFTFTRWSPTRHYLAREFRLAATLPDGTAQPLLWITDWDLDWQDQYRYLKPVRLPKGTLLTLAVSFDNSADNPRNPHKPPRRVHFGIGTDDEMCACHLEFLPDDPSGYKAYPQKSPFGL